MGHELDIIIKIVEIIVLGVLIPAIVYLGRVLIKYIRNKKEQQQESKKTHEAMCAKIDTTARANKEIITFLTKKFKMEPSDELIKELDDIIKKSREKKLGGK